MISKLPRWIWTGAWALAFVAGAVNVIGLRGFEHQAITHLTGTTSMLAVALAALDGTTSLHFAVVIAAFVAGTILSGFIIQDSTLRLGRRYGVALLVESVLLCVAVPLLKRNHVAGLYSASCAVGLQNAMVSAYSGAVVRTTHLTGMFTDLGIFIGHSLRGLPVDVRRLRLCLLVITGFLGGGIVGSLAYSRLDYGALFIPAGLTATASLSYALYRVHKRNAARRKHRESPSSVATDAAHR